VHKSQLTATILTVCL